MSVSISPVLNSQNFDANGNPLNGGLIYTYLAGSTTPATTYTDSNGLVPQSNPIVLNTRGDPDNLIWITDDISYKFVLKTSTGTTLRTLDDILNASPATVTQSEWIDFANTATYISTTQFSVAGDQTSIFYVNRRLKLTVSAGTVYGYVQSSVFSTVTTITVLLDSGNLDSGLSALQYSLIDKSINFEYVADLYSIGRNQTYQNVAASRSLGVTYTNTTDRPISVHIRTSITTVGDLLRATIDSQTVDGSMVAIANQSSTINFIVQPGNTYVVNVTGGTGTITSWKEMR